MQRIIDLLRQAEDDALAPARTLPVRSSPGSTRRTIAKPIEVKPSSGSSYHVKVEDAKQLVAQGDAIWDGPRRVIRMADKSKRGIWEPTMSGYAGPLVMQLS